MNLFDTSKKKLIAFAPMAGVSDVVYRGICSKYGAKYTYTEMVSALGISYNPERGKELRMRDVSENICALQLFGSDPKVMAKIAKQYHHDYDFIDINMGCPAPKIIKNNQGAALMKSPQLASDIVKAMVDAIDKPITVKIRIGWDEQHINAVEFAKMLEKAGASSIAVHGRHRQQFYAGKVDLDMIAKVKQAVSIPVIGNGDIFCAQDAKTMIDKTNCDGIMVARGAQGNPFIFEQITDLLNGNSVKEYTIEERIKIILEHAKSLENIFGEKIMSLKMRKHLCWYSKGLRNSTQYKKIAIKVLSYNDIENFCELLVSS